MACGSEAGCLSCNPCCGGGNARWFGSVGGIFMTRNMANPYWTTYNALSNPDQLLNSKQAGNGLWGGGGQLTFGRWWCPCRAAIAAAAARSYAYGVQFTYWQLADMSSSATVFSVNWEPWDDDGYDRDAGPSLSCRAASMAGTPSIRLRRHVAPGDLAHRSVFEHRAQRPAATDLQQSRLLRCTLLGGFRYFRFQDVLTYGSAADPIRLQCHRRRRRGLFAIERDQ